MTGLGLWLLGRRVLMDVVLLCFEEVAAFRVSAVFVSGMRYQ